MKFSDELGIQIDDEIRKTLEKAVSKAGNRRKLCLLLKISYTTLGNWLGANERQGEYITWAQWPSIRDYLVANQLLNGFDPRWLIPSEMRARLLEHPSDNITAEEWKLIQDYRLSSDETKENIRDMAARSAAKKKERVSASASTA